MSVYYRRVWSGGREEWKCKRRERDKQSARKKERGERLGRVRQKQVEGEGQRQKANGLRELGNKICCRRPFVCVSSQCTFCIHNVSTVIPNIENGFM